MTHPLIAGLGSSPDIFIHDFDVAGDRALIIRLSAEQRRTASFLDDRVLGRDVEGGWAPWSDIEGAARQAPAATPGFIFHVGHCGSTLASRLIESASGVRSLREPAAIRTLANVEIDAHEGLSPWSLAALRDRLRLYLNVAAGGAPTIIKATSWCGALAQSTPGPAAFCYTSPETFIATMLGGANNPIDLKLNAPIRLRRLRRLCLAPIADIAVLSPGELAAMSWACEAATMASVMTATPRRLLAVDFDGFLERPAEGLAGLLEHFGSSASPANIEAALTGPLMRTYSKDASFDYSPADRSVFLKQYKTAHADQIRAGLRWLDESARRFAPVADAFGEFGGGATLR